MRKKMVSPGHRKEVAGQLVAAGLCSGRAACRFLGLARATWWYRARPLSSRQARLECRLRELSEEHPRYGYRRIAALLRREGWAVGKRPFLVDASVHEPIPSSIRPPSPTR